jgi:hypothetical protein
MALPIADGYIKYHFFYYDIKGILHECNISNLDFWGVSTLIKGSVTLSYASVSNPIESIRGSGLTIQLDAETDLTFNDLYSEEERTYSVQYTRDNQILFNGWLSSEGLYQDWVSDKWIISLECVDGFGFLPDLAYVDSSGFPFAGNQTLLEIVSNCLKRTGILQNINTSINTYYTGLSTTLNIMDNVYYNADRFVKDDGNTIMSCEEVLNDVLQPFTASIVSFNGEWWIYKLNQLALDNELTYFRYNYNGVALSPATLSYATGFNLGSNIDSYYPCHANSNQSLTNKKSIGAYRISYKYGLVQSLLSNIFLQNIGGSIDEWTIDDATRITFPASNYGVILSDADATLTLHSDVISLSSGDNFIFKGRFTLTGNAVYFIARVKLVNGGTTYYLQNAGTWVTYANDISIYNGVPGTGVTNDFIGSGFEYSFSITSADLPISGDVTIELYTPDIDPVTAFPSYVGECLVSEIALNPTTTSADLKGEFHTFQRETKPSTKIKDTVKVNNGDNPSDLYYGTIYKTDGTTPTSTWFRKGITETKAILQLMGGETLRLSANTAKEFSGDVFGYIPFLSITAINGVGSDFVILEYNYDSTRNITSVKFIEIFSEELTDISYELTYDYGNTVKPTIIG